MQSRHLVRSFKLKATLWNEHHRREKDMKRHISMWCILTLVVLTAAVFGQAHHAAATFYDVNQVIPLTGVVTDIRMRNPHSSFMLEVTEEDGRKVSWRAEGPSAARMLNIAIDPGETVTVLGSPGRNPAAMGIVIWTVIKADGTTFGQAFGDPNRPEELLEELLDDGPQPSQ